MPDDLNLLDQLEEWLEAQVPSNLQDLPYRMLETMERVSNELFETLNMHGPPSISIPFPPFHAKEVPPPPPPPVPTLLHHCTHNRAGRLIKAHPFAIGAGAAVALGVGLGAATYLGYVPWVNKRARRVGTKGVVEDGYLKEAIVLLSPTPMPPLLWPLAVSLLRAGYVVLIAVPRNEDAEQLEKRLAPLEEKSALRVLVYDPEDPTTFPPFHRSLLATLSLRFSAVGAADYRSGGDPYNPRPDHIPHIHAFVSLYPLHPNPPNQPGALPALPALLAPDNKGKTPRLVTIYPSSSVMVQPDHFASQVISANHRLLGANLAASAGARIISVYVGHVVLPPLHQMINGIHSSSFKLSAREWLQHAKGFDKLFAVKDLLVNGLASLYATVAGQLGLGVSAQDYALVERRVLKALKSNHRTRWHAGQYAHLPFILSRLPLPILPRVLSILPVMPGPTGPAPVQGVPAPRRQLGTKRTVPSSKSVSATSSEHEHEQSSNEDLASSIHSRKSREMESEKGTDSDTGSVGSANGLDGSWVGLDGGN
ncbi:hypothetical protein BCR39DRAFT_375726 [Naematelia encephala]|uniref:DUF1776-domain-containing protein n=1 Tax=Naematelia encephala TaxID=71784 RepID=A0A1Y2BCT6_9TREE|nr:hypothetical protein BCR39DRAFT_375726 [Naematelia encephala]